MSDLEFILSNFNIKYDNITERDAKWIKEVLIPHVECWSNPIFGNMIMTNLFTQEVRAFNPNNLLKMLNNL